MNATFTESPSMSATFPIPHLTSMSSTGIALTVALGIISTICSMVILNIIRMSPQKLSTTYHRIMASMSIFDIIASLSMAVSTLPMPSDDILRYEGPMIGNKVTCQIQGYIVFLGLAGGGTLYMCLSWYFVCSITFRMSLEKIRKRIEPILLIYSATLALFLPSYLLSKDLLNVLPTASFCSIGTAHENCDYSIDEFFFACDSSTLNDAKQSVKWYLRVLFFNVAMVVLAMVIIIVTIFNKTRKINSYPKDQHLQGDEGSISDLVHAPENDEMNITELKHSRVMVIQALLYIFAYCITWVFILIITSLQLDENTKNALLYFRVILFPIQGLWNLIIFVYDKAYLVYRNNNDKGYWSAIKNVLVHPEEASPIIILPTSLQNSNDENIFDSPDRKGVDESSFHYNYPMEGPPHANDILRTMYRNQSRINVASQGQRRFMDSMTIIKLAHKMNPDFHHDRPPYYSSSTSNPRISSFRGTNPDIIEVDGRRGSWVYMNPSDRTSNASVIGMDGSNSTRSFSSFIKAVSNSKGASMENIKEERDGNSDDMSSEIVKS